MTLDTLLLLVVTVYLTLVAYGVARTRRLVGAARRVTLLLLVLLPPLLLAGGLVANGEGAVVAAWWRLFAAMPVVGAVVAWLADRIGTVAAR